MVTAQRITSTRMRSQGFDVFCAGSVGRSDASGRDKRGVDSSEESRVGEFKGDIAGGSGWTVEEA